MFSKQIKKICTLKVGLFKFAVESSGKYIFIADDKESIIRADRATGEMVELD